MASIGTNQGSARKQVCKELGRRGLRSNFFWGKVRDEMRLDKDEGMGHGVWVSVNGFRIKGKKLHMGVTIFCGVLYLLQITTYCIS